MLVLPSARHHYSGILLPVLLAFMVCNVRGQNPPPAGSGAVQRGGNAEETATDPSELFLKAFTAVQQAESLDRDGKMRPALAKYRFAASLLDQITQNHPNWQPLIVAYRSRKTADALTKLQEKVSLQSKAASWDDSE